MLQSRADVKLKRWRYSDAIQAGGIQMLYKRINVELIVFADEAEAVVAELEAALSDATINATTCGFSHVRCD
jgi:hypothetical protein